MSSPSPATPPPERHPARHQGKGCAVRGLHPAVRRRWRVHSHHPRLSSWAMTSTCCCRCPTIRSATRSPARWPGSRRRGRPPTAPRAWACRFPADEKSRLLKIKIEEILGTHLALRPAHPDHLSAQHRCPRSDPGPLDPCSSIPIAISLSGTGRRLAGDPPSHGTRRRSTAPCASARRWKNSSRCMPWPCSTTISGPLWASIPTMKASPNRLCRTWSSARPGPGGGHWRNRAGLLPDGRAQGRSGGGRSGVATGALSHPHPCRAPGRQAAGDPYPRRVG